MAIFAFIKRDFLSGDALVPYDAHAFYRPALPWSATSRSRSMWMSSTGPRLRV